MRLPGTTKQGNVIFKVNHATKQSSNGNGEEKVNFDC